MASVVEAMALSAAAGLSVLLVLSGLRRMAARPALLRERTHRYVPSSLREVELHQPLAERTWRPVLRRAAAVLRRRFGESRMAEIQRRLAVAGHPHGLTAEAFLTARAGCALVAAALGAGLSLAAGWRLLWLPALAGAGVLAVLLAMPALRLPDALLRSAMARRRALILTQLPEVLDVLTVTADAGVSFEMALVTVADKAREKARHGTPPGALVEELVDVVRRYQLGRPVLVGLRELADRLDLPDLSRLILALEQAKREGTALVETLAMQKEDIRRRALQRAEERAGRNSILILVPMVLFILPALLLVLAAPAAMTVAAGGGGGH